MCLSGKFSGNGQQDAALVNNRFNIQMMPLGDFKVYCGMGGGNGHRAGAKFHIGRRVFYYGRCYRTVYPFQFKRVAVLVFGVSFIIRMHYYVFVPEFCFRADRAYVEWPVFKMEENGSFCSTYSTSSSETVVFRYGSQLTIRLPAVN